MNYRSYKYNCTNNDIGVGTSIIAKIAEDILTLISKYQNELSSETLKSLNERYRQLTIIKGKYQGHEHEISNQILNQYLSADNVNYCFINGHYKDDASVTEMMVKSDFSHCFEIEDDVFQVTSQVWQHSLTEPIAYKEGMPFKYVVHATSGLAPLPGEEQYRSNEEYNNTSYISSSLISDQQMALYNSCYGLSFPVDKNNLICASSEDCVTQNHFQEQKTCGVRTVKKVGNTFITAGHFEGETIVTRTALPSRIEEDTLTKGLEHNGEPLNYDKQVTYNEVVLDKTTSKPNGVIFISSGIEFLLNEYCNAVTLAENYNVPLVIIDKSLYRVKAGLPPYTDGEKAKLSSSLSNIDHKINTLKVNGYTNDQIKKMTSSYLDQIHNHTDVFDLQASTLIKDTCNSKIINSLTK